MQTLGWIPAGSHYSQVTFIFISRCEYCEGWINWVATSPCKRINLTWWLSIDSWSSKELNETASKVRMQASGMKTVEVRKEQRVECARVVVNQHGTDIAWDCHGHYLLMDLLKRSTYGHIFSAMMINWTEGTRGRKELFKKPDIENKSTNGLVKYLDQHNCNLFVPCGICPLLF